MSLSPAQCRAARALLNWTQEDLVTRCKITKKTIADFERGATQPRAQTLAQITAAFEATGIELLNAQRPGVRLREKAR
jgi:transcriptional regulator with XRE-family HTH domain